MTRRIILDADTIIYKVAANNEVVLESSERTADGSLPLFVTHYADPETVLKEVKAAIDRVGKKHHADKMMVCVTDAEHNFRLDVDPTYKANRKHGRKPLAVKYVRDWLGKQSYVFAMDALEADDIAGILMTHPKYAKDECICISDDKDMLTIPGNHINGGVERFVTDEAADYFHLLQTVMGDPTDGVKGLPGVGKVGAKKLLEEVDYSWKGIVEHAIKKGFDEEYMLRQARLVRILRYTDYDHKNKKPILWTPDV